MAPKAHFPILKLSDFDGLDGMLMIDIAATLKRSKYVVRSAITRLGIRDRFPRHGAEAVNIARKGYIR